MTKVFLTFYKGRKQISKTIETTINEYAASKGGDIAIDGEISWHNHPDKARIFIPKHKKVYYYRITYKPYYASRAAERAGIVTSYTHENKLTYTRNV